MRGSEVELDGLVSDLDGETLLRHRGRGPSDGAAAVGRALAERLIGEGADEILAEVRRLSGVPPAPAP